MCIVSSNKNALSVSASAAPKGRGNCCSCLLYTSVAGVINVVLNLLFVIVFQMSVAGVAPVSYTHLDVYKRQ